MNRCLFASPALLICNSRLFPKGGSVVKLNQLALLTAYQLKPQQPAKEM